MSTDRRDLLAHLVIGLAVLALGWPLVAGRVPYYGDLTLQFAPWHEVIRQHLGRGVLPLWLPDVYLGTPFLANDQSAVLYPWHALTAALSGARSVAVGLLAHLWLAAAGGYAFARRAGVSPGGALITGLAYGLGGYLVSKQQFPSLGYTIAWLPWLAWASRRLAAAPGPRPAAALALLVGLQWLSGHAQMAVLQTALLLAWFASLPRDTATARRWGWWLAALALGAGLGLAQLAPTAELLGWSPRSSFGFADVARFNLPPWQTANLVLPDAFGAPHRRLPYLGVGPYWETAWYVGLVTLPLAVAGARGRRFWVVAALVGVLLAWGRYTPVYGWCYHLLPPLRIFRDPARFTLYAVFALAVLAGYGYDESGDRARRVTGWLAGLLAVGLAGAVLLPAGAAAGLLRGVLAWSPTKQVADLAGVAVAWRDDLAGQAVGALLVVGLAWGLLSRPAGRRWLPALLAVELILRGVGLNPTAPAAWLAEDPRPAAVPRDGLLLVPRETLAGEPGDCFTFTHYGDPACLRETRRTLAPNVTVGTGTRQVWGYDPLRAAAVLDVLQRLDQGDFAARQARLAPLGVAGEWRDGRWLAYTGVRSEAQLAGRDVAWQRLTPQRVAIQTSGGGGELRFTQPWLPGWRAVGAERVPGAVVPSRWRVAPGTAEVRLVYAPGSFRVGLFAALLALGVVAGLVTAAGVKRGRVGL